MVVFVQWWYRRRQRVLASRRGKVDVEKGTPLEKLAAAMNLKNKGGSTGTSSAGLLTANHSMHIEHCHWWQYLRSYD